MKRPGILWIVIAFALFVRGTIAYSSLELYESDPDAYRAIAVSISEHGVFGPYSEGLPSRPTAFRPPLYPFLLSFLTSGVRVSSFSVATLHTLLGVLTAVIVFGRPPKSQESLQILIIPQRLRPTAWQVLLRYL